MLASVSSGRAADDQSAEATVRALVRANAEKDIETMSRLIAHDADITSYTIGGRKYVGWGDLERDMEEEFKSAATIEIPIRELKVWTRGDLAWYAMEVDYIRTVTTASQPQRALLPLRETGVLERRDGHWVLLSWHESFRTAGGAVALNEHASVTLASSNNHLAQTDLSGEWEILEVEDDKRYRATLDKAGNGPYTQHGGPAGFLTVSGKAPGSSRAMTVKAVSRFCFRKTARRPKASGGIPGSAPIKISRPANTVAPISGNGSLRSPPPLDEPAIGS
jgi:hypothetical protein